MDLVTQGHAGSQGNSRKLNQLFKAASEKALRHPEAGSNTDVQGVKVYRIRTYKMFYEMSGSEIIILRIWDSRRDPQTSGL
jgi:plasmid stabilization system protein ParE